MLAVGSFRSSSHFPSFSYLVRVFSILFLLCSRIATAKPVNRTVDDSDNASLVPDGATPIKYSASSPVNGWMDSVQCQNCTAHPDAQFVHAGTWHDGTYDPQEDESIPLTASLTFKGSAVYVYFILPQTKDSPKGHSACTFEIDGEKAGQFVHEPTGQAGYLPNQLVFSRDGLSPNQTHTVAIQNDAFDGKRSLVLLDRIDFTSDDGQESEGDERGEEARASGLSTGAIGGIALGGTVVISGICALLFLWWKRRRQAGGTRPYISRGSKAGLYHHHSSSESSTSAVSAISPYTLHMGEKITPPSMAHLPLAPAPAGSYPMEATHQLPPPYVVQVHPEVAH